MKFINKSIVAIVLGMSAVTASHATNVYLSGSTALRSTVFKAMTTSGVIFTTTPTFTGYGGSGNGDTFMAFQGPIKGITGNPSVTVKCFWSGSEAGIKDLVSTPTPTELFIADGSLNGLDNAGTPSAGTTGELQPVNLCMADTAQADSQTLTPKLTTGSEVGIVTFKFVRSQGPWKGTNVTDEQIRSALGGSAAIGLFTATNDDSSFVYVAGRDTSSGTRANALGDTGYGIYTPVSQIELSGGVMQDVNSDGTFEGNYGQSSGGTLAKSITFDFTSATDSTANGGTGFTVISYLGFSDAVTALAGTGGGVAATELTYNGIPFSTTNIENGTYNFWGNEFCYKANNVTSVSNPSANQVFLNLTSIAAGVDTIFDNLSAIPLDLMHATRPGAKGDPSHN